jgi:hypothetical protein
VHHYSRHNNMLQDGLDGYRERSPVTTVRHGEGLRPASEGLLIVWLMWIGVGTTLGGLAFYNPYEATTLNLVLGAFLAVAGLMPLSGWLSDRKARVIPLLPMHGLFYAVCFGFAGLTRTPDIALGPRAQDADYTRALLAAILSWLIVVLGYAVGTRARFRISTSLSMVSSNESNRVAILVLYPLALLASLWADSANQVVLLELTAGLRRLLFVWVVHAAWSGQLDQTTKAATLALIIPVELVLFVRLADGVLYGLFVYGYLLSITYAVTHRRVPIIVPAIVVALFVALQPAKETYRAATGNTDAVDQGSIDSISMFVGMAWDNMAPVDVLLTTGDTLEVAYTRLNHLHTLANVMADTPDSRPYQYGATLLPLLTKWIPRVVWPDKPLEDLGNRWAHEYGYLNPTDYATSYNLPWVAEMYMNAGWLGVAILSCLVGTLMGVVRRCLILTHTSSPFYALALVSASAFFCPESNISLQIGGMVASGVLGLLLLGLIRLSNTSILTTLRGAGHQRRLACHSVHGRTFRSW